ncbi:MAG: 3-methyl-2-oxobutanoate dehydrogenase subunit beta, partial [Spirochaetes bacterium]|nr:3-methyl-2-oxobutanoate dehydrogenase subunit beta [Spirochaetota bacterium]
YEAFDLADEWRMPCMVLADGMIGQMMEGVELPDSRDLKTLPQKNWAVGHKAEAKRDINHVTSLNLMPADLEKQNIERYKRYDVMKKTLQRSEEVNIDKAELVIVAYGTSARVALGALEMAKAEGIEIGLFRPITLWPFPEQRLSELAAKGKRFLVVEMSMGQMVEDVRLTVNGRSEVLFYGRCGGVIPTEEEVLAEIKRLLGK